MRCLLTTCCLFVLTVLTAQAQLQLPQPSPMAKVTQTVGLTDVTVEYSRPGMRGRDIFGDLVPYGEVWRTGANASTKITFDDPVTVRGQELPAGTYALYTIPNPNEWTIIFYKDLELGGNTSRYDPSQDVLRVMATPSRTGLPVETFTIAFTDLQENSAKLEMLWDDVRVALPLSVETESKTARNIETALAEAGDDWRPYAQAANYYLQNDVDNVQAMQWLDQSVAKKRHFWNLHLQSVAYAKAGDYQQALASAEQALPMAKEAENAFYIGQIEGNIEKWQGMIPAKKRGRRSRRG
ncbi:MAG: DUF2911 domain-containing protein [Catalinimonas sp.]